MDAYDGRGWQFYVFEVDGWSHVEAWRPDGSTYYAPSPMRDASVAAALIAGRNEGAVVDVVDDPREVADMVRCMAADRRRHDNSWGTAS